MMKKEEAIRIVVSCAIDYHENLAGRNILFIYGNVSEPKFLECRFDSSNYKHLTGVVFEGSGSHFYNLCLDKRLPSSSIALKEDGSTEMKLHVLPQLMQIHKKAKMIGSYAGYKNLLVTEKIVGNTTACLGFALDEKIGFYVPNTALKEDMRNISTATERVLAVFRKAKSAPRYNEQCYIAKGVTLSSFSIDIHAH